MGVVSILTHVEFGRNDHREGASHFTAIDEIQIQCHIKEKYFELLTVSICYALPLYLKYLYLVKIFYINISIYRK